ncbi:histone-fold-containing protein [Aspergillus multicolor]|uniref:putative CBF/NF-Y family transcription factor n=1 Tax=Aspergillus multicolor TaxID=41759 RepID=UPI003CCE390A
MSASPPPDADAESRLSDPAQVPAQPLQATEQQLKARAEGVSIEDYLLPRSITLRLAKSVLPPNTSVQKDAVLAIQKAATVFVSYLSSHANEATLKRTVSPADVLAALSELEFEGFGPRLEKELDKYNDLKAAKRKPRKSGDGDTATGAATETSGGASVAGADGISKHGDEEMGGVEVEVVLRGARAKRVKRDGNGNGEVEVDDHENEDDEDDEGDDVGEVDEVEEEHEEDGDATEDEEEEDEDEDKAREDEDIDRVEDLDRGERARRMVDPDAAGDSDSDDEGPGSQLRGDLGLG